ncbi:MAG: phosphoribosylamine--glycine ligase [Acidobacteria bacterium]|nr:phosphoribosylamine--glycine ligase [Acidobacteriota bacterium]
MKILVIGSGGREHALTWKLRESQLMEEIYCAPGNPGIAQEAECHPVDVADPKAILALAQELKADLTVMGPEAPLVAGAVDELEQAGLWAVGPTRAAAQLEGSKIFSKQFMQRHSIPTARFEVAENFESAIKALANFKIPVVVKADGLAAGKGVVVARRREEAEQALDEFMRRKTLREAGGRVVIEECLTGEELSFIIFSDGKNLLPLVPTQDHKAVFDNDEGPNTGGMGAYSDDAILDNGLKADILQRIALPTLAGMAAEGNPFRGFLYIGVMMTPSGPSVLEYNVRLGDPEAQPILMRLRSDLVEIFKGARDGELEAIEARWSPNPAVCVVLASKGYPGKPEVGKVITGYDAAESQGGVKVFHAGTAFHDGQLLTAGGRVLGVTATGADLKSALDRAYAAVGKIRFEGMHFRRDIGAKGLKRMAKNSARKGMAPQSASGAPKP